MKDTHPFKVLKYCPKCGSCSFMVSGERSLKCRDCGFHFFVNSATAVAALIANQQGKLLLTTRGVDPGRGLLDLPGGFVDPGESAEQAVKRELWEELRLKVSSLEYLGSAPNEYIFSGYSVFTHDMAFKVIPESISGLKPMDDVINFGFYSNEEIDYSKIQGKSINFFVKQFFNK